MKVLLVIYGVVVTILYLLEREAHTEITEVPVINSTDTLKTMVHQLFDGGAKEVEIKIRNPNA